MALEDYNLITLCNTCHSAFNRANAQYRAKLIKKYGRDSYIEFLKRFNIDPKNFVW
jgi:hypothetical protein